MIATVAAGLSVASHRADSASSAAKASGARQVVARIKVLIGRNARYSETVRFADPRAHSVRVVRGKKTAPAGPTVHGADETVTFVDRRQKSVRVVRGGPVVATVSVVLPATPPGQSLPPRPQIVSFAGALGGPVTILRGMPAARLDLVLPAVAASPYLDLFAPARSAELDRVAFAVDGAESSHGADPAMWRAVLSGPQGPMQVSAAAAVDSGGGDRFDLAQNRQLGRAYLARLYRRYGNWPDAVAAYNWGPGNLDAWIAQGRPALGLPLGVERYRERVLREGGVMQSSGSALSAANWRSQSRQR